MVKSRYYELLDKCGVPKTTPQQALNILFLILKYTSMKHKWGVISVGEVTRKRVREVISLTKI